MFLNGKKKNTPENNDLNKGTESPLHKVWNWENVQILQILLQGKKEYNNF